MEPNLIILVLDAPNKIKFKAYDLFDQLCMDAHALAKEIDADLLDVVLFMQHKFKLLQRKLKKLHG